MSQVDAIADALQAACKGDGDQITVDLDLFERLLTKEKVRVEKANKAVLNAELQATREELRVQLARAANAEEPESFRARLSELEQRELELTHQLWPPREAT